MKRKTNWNFNYPPIS